MKIELQLSPIDLGHYYDKEQSDIAMYIGDIKSALKREFPDSSVDIVIHEDFMCTMCWIDGDMFCEESEEAIEIAIHIWNSRY